MTRFGLFISLQVKRRRQVAAALIFLALWITALGSCRQANGETEQYVYEGNLIFDLQRVPFSRFGSYLSISDLREFRLPYAKTGFTFAQCMVAGGMHSASIYFMMESWFHLRQLQLQHCSPCHRLLAMYKLPSPGQRACAYTEKASACVASRRTGGLCLIQVEVMRSIRM